MQDRLHSLVNNLWEDVNIWKNGTDMKRDCATI